MSSRRISGITIEIDGNTQKLNDSLKSVDKQLASTQSQLKDVEKLLKLDPRNTELLSQKQKLLSESIEGTKDRLQQLEKAQKELASKDSTPEVAKQQEALQREIIETKNKLKGFEDELGKVPNKAQLAFESIGDGLKKTGEKMSEVGENMTKYVTGPIAAAGAASVAAFTEVDDAMDTVIKKTGATGEALEGMQKSVENLATTLPTSFDEAANAIGEINTRFGLTGQELEDLSGQFIKFAQLNNTTVSDSVDRTQRLMAAFGVETKDASKILDILNKTGQKTGISVDKLSDLMTTNAASLQEMGLSAAGAAEFLGAVEMSGADVSVVMRALNAANKKAAKEGKSLNDVLGKFSKTMNSNATEAEKMQAAIELFGSKGGPAIYNAAKQGTLSLDNLTASMDSAAGSVTQTFEGTLDGIDNWTMAVNQAKLLASDIGGMLSEFAGPILQKVRDALQEAVGWWRGLNSEQQDTIVKVAGIVAAIGPAVTVVGKLTSAVGLLSQGLGILAAHPVAAAVIGLTTAFGGLALAIKGAGDKGEAYMQQTYGVDEAMQANIEKIGELKAAYEESNKQKDLSFEKFDAEYGYLQELATEYDGYLDKNGHVIEKYKERAEFIETTLAEALGIEKEDIQKIVEANGSLSGSIDEVITKRKAEALLNSLQDEYTQAIQGTKSAEEELLKAEGNLEAKTKALKDLEAERNRIQALQNDYIQKNGYASSEYADQLQDLRVDIEYATEAEKQASQAVADAEETYLGYQATIQQYEGVSAAAIEGDTNRISLAMDRYRNDFRTTETATVNTLKKQVEDYKTEYEEAKAAVERGSKTITKADLAEKQYWYKQAQLEYNKATKASRDAAAEAASGYASKMRGGRKAAASAAEYMGGGVTNELQSTARRADQYGYSVAAGMANGIRSNAHLATYAAGNMANAIEERLRGALQIHSPSRLTAYFGEMLDEGLAIGMNGGLAVKAAENLAREVAQPFETQQNRDTIANAAPVTQANMVDAFQTALSRMKVEMDDREMGSFVEKTVVKAVYA
jgi:TP901 family phage tail tape measure protein